MKKIALSFVALAALSGGAFADSLDGDDQAPYRPGDNIQDGATSSGAVNPLEAQPQTDDVWLNGRYGLTKDPMDVRRWDEKGGN